ncbi:MAG: hypothetical protein IKB70_12710, partial [Bacilli bacterium]|nr:hypothetical protein [Bacilli bacterium]
MKISQNNSISIILIFFIIMRVDVIIQLNYQAVILFDNMNKISQLSISKQTVVISSIITIVAFLTSTFCFFLGWFDIPLG